MAFVPPVSIDTIGVDVRALTGIMRRSLDVLDDVYIHVDRLMQTRSICEPRTLQGETYWFRLPSRRDRADYDRIYEEVDRSLLAAEDVELGREASKIARAATAVSRRLLKQCTMTKACVYRWGYERALLDCTGLLHGPGSYCCLFWQMEQVQRAYASLGCSDSGEGSVEDFMQNYSKLEVDYVDAHI